MFIDDKTAESLKVPMLAPVFTDSNEYWGAWLVIPDLETAAAGVLRIEPDGSISLRMMADWAQYESAPGFIGGVHGTTESGRKLTLYGLTGGTAFESEFASYFKVQSVVSKGHLFDPADTMLSRYRVRFSGLEKWLAHGYFRRDGIDPYSADETEIFKWPLFDPSDSHAISRHGLTVSFGGVLHPEHQPFVSTTWHSAAWMEIVSDEPQTLPWFIEKTRNVQNLLSALGGMDFSETYAWGDTVDDDPNSSVEYFHPRYLTSRAIQDSGLPPTLFDYLDVKESFVEYCSRWLDEAGQLAAIHSLLFGMVTADVANPVPSFLGNVQAVEAFMRMTSDSTVATSEEFDRARTAMLGALGADTPVTLRDKLRGVLTYANEPSLRRRIAELLEGLPIGIQDLITRNRSVFIQKIVTSRNALTHIGTDTRPGLNSELEFIAASELLRVAVFSALLKRIGMNDDAVGDRLKEHPWFQWISAISPGSELAENR